MVNLQAIMLRLCEPFMDAHYTKVRSPLSHILLCLRRRFQIDRIDTLYYAHSSRIDLKEETRINATSAEAEEWREQQQAKAAGTCTLP